MTAKTSLASGQLRGFIERIERVREEKKALADDEKQVFAEAKASGFDTKTMRGVLKLRQVEASDRAEAEALMATYLHAMGMAADVPLFKGIELMGDGLAREQLVEAFKTLAPVKGYFIVKTDGQIPLRIWRDDDEQVHAEDYVDPRPKAEVAKPDFSKPRLELAAKTEVTIAAARKMGKEAGIDDPAAKNPFPKKSPQAKAWDDGWRKAAQVEPEPVT